MKIQNDIDLFVNVYSLVEAISKGFNIDIETSKGLVLKAFCDKTI